MTDHFMVLIDDFKIISDHFKFMNNFNYGYKADSLSLSLLDFIDHFDDISDHMTLKWSRTFLNCSKKKLKWTLREIVMLRL